MKLLRSRIRNLRIAGAAATTFAAAATAGHAAPRVVLIHGIWDTSRTLKRMDTAIQKAGFETLRVQLDPNDGSATLDQLAAQVNRDIVEKFGREAVFSIVGLSMGGLVARSYLRQFGDPDRIPAIVTIGSPHHGTWLAEFSELPGVKDMRASSGFLRTLDADNLRFPNTRWTTIRTPFDLIILPSVSSELPWAENHAVPVLAHPLLACDSRVIRQTLCGLGVSTMSEPAERVSRHAGSLPKRIPGIPPLPMVSPEAQ